MQYTNILLENYLTNNATLMKIRLVESFKKTNLLLFNYSDYRIFIFNSIAKQRKRKCRINVNIS